MAGKKNNEVQETSLAMLLDLYKTTRILIDEYDNLTRANETGYQDIYREANSKLQKYVAYKKLILNEMEELLNDSIENVKKT